MTTDTFILKEKVASLQEALLSKHPRMPTLLREIHTALKAQPEQVLLLSPEDMGTIFAGLEVQTGNFLAASIAKGSGSTTNAAKKSIKANASLALDL